MSPAADDMIPCAFAPPLAEASAVAPLSDLPHPTANTTKLNNVHPAESGRANFQYIFSLPCFGDQGAIRPIYQSEGLDHFPPSVNVENRRSRPITRSAPSAKQSRWRQPSQRKPSVRC
jgi:hypothetical protein